MFGPDPTEAGTGSAPGEGAPVPPSQLELFSKAIQFALMAGMEAMRRGEEYDFGQQFLDRLSALSNLGDKGSIKPSAWVCINTEDGSIGRAYPYRGEYRIVPILDDGRAMEDLLAFERDLNVGSQFE